jgi:putative intracellular protease/amidase
LYDRLPQRHPENFEHPGEVRMLKRGWFELVRLGGMTIGRATCEPGSRGSEHEAWSTKKSSIGGRSMKALFIITSSDKGAWLSEVTHPYWHLTERGVEVDFASPEGGKVVWTPLSDPYGEGSQEPDDLVSKGFLSDKVLAAKFDTTIKLKEADLARYDAVHVAGGQGATYDLYPNEDVARALEHFWAGDKIVGAICHGAVALGNNPNRVRRRRATGYSLEGDRQLEAYFGPGFLIPHYPQKVLEEVGVVYSSDEPTAPCVVVDGKLVTGQNQQSASEYGVVLFHAMAGRSPVSAA